MFKEMFTADEEGGLTSKNCGTVVNMHSHLETMCARQSKLCKHFVTLAAP